MYAPALSIGEDKFDPNAAILAEQLKNPGEGHTATHAEEADDATDASKLGYFDRDMAELRRTPRLAGMRAPCRAPCHRSASPS